MSSLDVCLHCGFLSPYKGSVCILTPFANSLSAESNTGVVVCHKDPKEMLFLEKSNSFVVVSSVKPIKKGWTDKRLSSSSG